MKKGIQLQYDNDFYDVLKVASKVGFKYVSLGFGSSKIFHNSDWEKHIISINKALEENNIECIQTHLPYYDLRISAEILDENMDLAHIRCIEASAKLGSSWSVYHARTAVNDNYSPRKSMALAKKVISPILEAAVRFDTGFAVENLPHFPGWHEAKFFTSDYEDLLELYDYFNDSHFGICYDFGHAHLMRYNYINPENEAKPLSILGDRIKATHIHNNFGFNDDHSLPSSGDIDWEIVMCEFKKYYKGALMLEVEYPRNSMTESFLAHSLGCVEYLEGLMK